MKKYFIALLLFTFLNASAQTYRNEAYTFVLHKDNTFELFLNYDIDKHTQPRRTFCEKWSYGKYQTVTDEFIQLQSDIKFDEEWEVKFVKKEFIPEQDSIHIKIIVDNFKKLDSENFDFLLVSDGKSKIEIERNNSDLILNCSLEIQYLPSILIDMAPSNKKFVLSDSDSYYDGYSNLLDKLLTKFTIPEGINSVEVKINGFDICSLYKTHIHGEYIRKVGDKMYWRNEELTLVK